QNDYYMGICDGEISDDPIKSYVNGSDVILNIGAKLTDSATAGFSYQFNLDDVIMINHHNFKVDALHAEEVRLTDLLEGLLEMDYVSDVNYPHYHVSAHREIELIHHPLTQSTDIKLIQSFIKPKDIILAEQGTSFFGTYDLALYKENKLIGQPVCGAISYTMPATLGTPILDNQRRTLL